MDRTTRMICIVVFVCLGPVFCVMAGVPGKRVSLETEAQLEMDKKIKSAQRHRDRLDTMAEKLPLPADSTDRFVVRELRINGNTLLSDDELLKDLPAVFDSSDPSKPAESGDLYDLRAIHDIIAMPGRVHKVSTREMFGLMAYFLSVYEDRGFAGIYMYVSAEARPDTKKAVLKDDILPIQVLEAKTSQVNAKYQVFDPDVPADLKYRDLRDDEKPVLKESVLREWSPVKEGQTINREELDRFVNLLNLNPDRYISPIVSRGTTSDSLTLDYEIFERNPWHFYVQSDNSGSKERRWNPRFGVINTNLTGIDDKIVGIYQGPLHEHPADPFRENYSVHGSYELPLWTPRLRLNLYTGHSNFDISTDDAGGFDFRGAGDYHGGILRYNLFQFFLADSDSDPWFLDITGSLSNERSRVKPSLGAKTNVEMDLWSAGVALHHADDLTDTSVSFTQTESFDGSSQERFTEARLGTKPDFTINTLTAAHSQYDTDRIGRAGASFRWVDSDERLVAAKMTPFGGLYSVRGYGEDEIVADGGMLISAQYEFDLVKHGLVARGNADSPSGTQAEKPWLRKAAPLVFYDYGRAITENPVVGETRVQKLSSYGVGILATIGDNFDGSVYYGIPLRTTTDPSTGETLTHRNDGRWSFNLVYRW